MITIYSFHQFPHNIFALDIGQFPSCADEQHLSYSTLYCRIASASQHTSELFIWIMPFLERFELWPFAYAPSFALLLSALEGISPYLIAWI